MDNLDFLDAGEPANTEAQPAETPAAEAPPEPQAAEATPTEATPEKPAPARGPDGKFAKKEPEAEPIMVPIQALHETRDKVKDLEARIAALQPQQAQPQQQQVPDMFESPEAYTAYLQNQISQVALNERLNLSEEMVRQSAGDETVNAAQEWGRQQMASNPAFAQEFYGQRNPYGFLVQRYQRHALMSQLGDDPKQIEAFLAWKTAQGQVQQQPEPQPSPAPPPRSIASATSAGGVSHQAIGPGVAFGDAIK